eukprot:361328_1
MTEMYSSVVVYIEIPISIVVFLMLIVMICQFSKLDKVVKSQQCMIIITYLSCLLWIIMDMLRAIACSTNNISLLHPTGWIFYIHICADIFFYIGSISLYLLLIQRVVATFEGSQWPVSRCFLIYIIILIILQILTMITHIYELLKTQNKTIIAQQTIAYLSIFLTVFDSLLNISLYGLFIKKLRQLVLNQYDMSDFGGINKSTDIELNNTALKFIALITKQTILSIYGTFWNQTFFIFHFFAFVFGNARQFELYLTIKLIMRALDAISIVIVLFLSFGCNDKWYQKLCGNCHYCCYNCWLKQTQKKIYKHSHDYFAL